MKKQIQYIITLLCFFWAFTGQAQKKNKLAKHEKEAIQLIYEGNQEITKEKANVVEAEKSYRKAIAKDPDNATAKYNLGVSYHATQNFQEAAQRSEQAAKLAKTEFEKHSAYHNLGNAYMGTGQADKAVEAYKNALRNNPTDHETRYNLALAKQMKKEQDKNKSKDGDKNKEKGDSGKNDEDSKEKDKNEEDSDKNKDDKKDDKKEGENEDEKDKDKPSDDDKKDNENEGDKGDKDEEKKPAPPKEGKLSPEQVKSLLQAMENQEKEVQEKVNANKAKGVQVKSEKDW